jgi:hypothetical protein
MAKYTIKKEKKKNVAYCTIKFIASSTYESAEAVQRVHNYWLIK